MSRPYRDAVEYLADAIVEAERQLGAEGGRPAFATIGGAARARVDLVAFLYGTTADVVAADVDAALAIRRGVRA